MARSARPGYRSAMIAAVLLACALHATDGDTLRCGAERIRLVGIDAPELPGHCRRGRRCVPGDGHASRRHLARGLDGRAAIVRFGRDRYGRTLAIVEVDGRDLACRQLAAGHAAYRARWDVDGRVGRRCRAAGVRVGWAGSRSGR